MKKYTLSLITSLLFSTTLHARELYIYSASSIAWPLEQIIKKYTPHKVHIVSAASPILAMQIKYGAKADIFISAHPQWLNLIPATATEPLTTNRLILVLHPDSNLLPAHLKNRDSDQSLHLVLKQLQNQSGRLALTDSQTPAGLYSQQALKHYGLWEIARPLAIFGQSSQITLRWIVGGDADAAIIYASDTTHYPQLKRAFLFPETSHSPIIYHMARLNENKETLALWAFLKENHPQLSAFGFQQ